MRVRTMCWLVLSAAVALAACSAPRQTARTAPPANPDLTPVLERYYQQVEGRHWFVAYAMLSPHYRTAVSEPDFRERYAGLGDADVNVRQTTDRSAVATLVEPARTDGGRRRAVEETVSLTWDGEDWQIDAMRRRTLSVPAAQ